MRLASFLMRRPRIPAVLETGRADPIPTAGLDWLTSHGFQLAILAFAAYFLIAIVIQKGYFLLTEDHLFEYWTAANYFAGAIVCLIGPRV